MSSYIGKSPNLGQLYNPDVFSGTGSQTTFTLTNSVTSDQSVIINISGVKQQVSTYSISNGTSLVFGTAPPSATNNIEVQYLGSSVDVGTVGSSAIGTSQIASNAVTTAKIIANAIDETKLKDALVADFTEVVVTASDSILLGDATDGGNTKRDTVQGILDLAGGGGLIYLAKVTASGSSTVDFLNNFSSTYDNYVIFMDGVIMSTENVGVLHIRTVTGGSSVQTGANYSYCFSARTDAGADNHHNGSGQIYAKIQPVGTGTGTGENYGGRIEIYGVNEASNYTLANVQYSIFGKDERVESGHGAFCWEVVTAVTGVQFVPNTGTISEGNFTLFGVAKA